MVLSILKNTLKRVVSGVPLFKSVLTRLCCAKSFARFARNTDLGALPPVAPAGAVDKTPAHTGVWTADCAGSGLDHRQD